MGASIGMAHGMEKARGGEFARKLVSVIGDSTFMHSGITGLVNMIYNGATSTVLILDNSTTGMTGHQDCLLYTSCTCIRFCMLFTVNSDMKRSLI